MSSSRERVVVNQAKVSGKKNDKQNLTDHYHELREESKKSVAIERKIADALKDKDDIAEAKDFDISQDLKKAKAVERSHYTDVMKYLS